MTISYLYVGELEQRNMQKVVSKGWCKESKFLDTQHVCCYHPEIQTERSLHREICQKVHIEWQTVSDQTTLRGAVQSWSALLAKACLSENLGLLLYKYQQLQT